MNSTPTALDSEIGMVAVSRAKKVLGRISNWLGIGFLFLDSALNPWMWEVHNIGDVSEYSFRLMIEGIGVAVVGAMVFLGIGRILLVEWRRLELSITAILCAVIGCQLLFITVAFQP